jgi:hypothetical protein
MVDTKAGVSGPRVSVVVPEGVDALTWMERPQRIGPASRDQTMERLSDFGPEQRVIDPALGLMNVQLGGHHIEIAGEHDRHTCRKKLRGMPRQPIEPAQLVIELGARSRISVGQIQAANQHAIHRRLDVSAVRILQIAW